MKVPFLGVTVTGGFILGTMVAIIATGVFLDEAGSGKFGATLQKLAIKTTNGYGK